MDDGRGDEAGVRLVMLPGLGADHRLFLPQLKAFDGSLVPAWIEPEGGYRGGESLESYSVRMLGSLRERGLLSGRYALVGFSFGGQVALEMCRAMVGGVDVGEGVEWPVCVVLISGCRTREAVTDEFRRRARRGMRLPRWMVRAGVRMAAGPFARSCGLDASWTRVLREMARDVDAGELLWGGSAAAEWAMTRSDVEAIEAAGIGVYQIHGREDSIIPVVEGHADEVVDGAGHLLQWTHAEVVNGFIEGSLVSAGARRS